MPAFQTVEHAVSCSINCVMFKEDHVHTSASIVQCTLPLGDLILKGSSHFFILRYSVSHSITDFVATIIATLPVRRGCHIFERFMNPIFQLDNLMKLAQKKLCVACVQAVEGHIISELASRIVPAGFEVGKNDHNVDYKDRSVYFLGTFSTKLLRGFGMKLYQVQLIYQ